MATEKQNHSKIVLLEAAGGVVLRGRGDGEFEVVVCGRSPFGLWALPKGKPNDGESPLENALREVREETGLEVRAGPLAGEIRYSFYRPEDGAVCYKVVRFYLMSASGGDISEHDAEFDQVVWLPAGDAVKRLTYPNEARILEKAVALAKGQAAG
jgi:8-oxo-dGTP pyrophosphatase MutT (NUDIX family)